MPKITRQQLRAQCRALGMSVRERDGEIRINYSGAPESEAYYTNDRADALATAQNMAVRRAFDDMGRPFSA